ncbi:YggS family pyridoxal phosphate enzyme [Gammaproteobacteria bacterium 45_16_T64]|nr:YggS family pyridoxal phosphate enzyme [Gammaproteobacteria bacterium 45_16_T64]
MTISEQQIPDRLKQVTNRIEQVCRQHQQSHPTLLAVSKTRSISEIREMYQLGVTQFGENYLQESLEKQQQLIDCDICWHFIGPIQSNKTRSIAEKFQWVHSVDRLKLANRLSNQRPPQLPELNICLQVNIDNESSKSGFSANEVVDAAKAIAQLPRLRLRGLMCIPEPRDNTHDQRQPFAKMQQLLKQINQQLSANIPPLDSLSMGMSSDIEAAVAEGSTIVRVGTALFGPRSTQSSTT